MVCQRKQGKLWCLQIKTGSFSERDYLDKQNFDTNTGISGWNLRANIVLQSLEQRSLALDSTFETLSDFGRRMQFLMNTKEKKITTWIVKHRNWLPRNQGISTHRDFQNSAGKCPEQPDLILQLAPPSVGDWTRWFPEVQSSMNFSTLLQFSWCARCWRHLMALASIKNFGVFRWTLSSSDVLFLSVWTMDRLYNLFLDVIKDKLTCREDFW